MPEQISDSRKMKRGRTLSKQSRYQPFENSADMSVPSLQVYGMGAMKVEPDIIEFTASVESTKKSVDECKESVKKRMDYVMQVVHDHNVQEHCMSLFHKLTSISRQQYCYSGQMHIQCDSVQQFEEIRNMLVEKLGADVTVSNPHVRHSVNKLQSARRQVSLSATEEAQQKAEDLAATLGQDLGPPVRLEEEGVQETFGVKSSDDPTSLLSQFKISTVEMEARVNITFELIVEK